MEPPGGNSTPYQGYEDPYFNNRGGQERKYPPADFNEYGADD